ncbi:hypothetical protein PS2_006019 [Malus domestica]
MLRTGFFFDPYSASKLITVCALSSSSKVKPNSVTFTNVLCACSHARLMELVYGVVPGLKHYACMVDILGHSGNLEEVVELIEKMSIAHTASTGKWEEVSGLRKRTRDAGMKKEPVYSATEVNSIVPEFIVGDSSHPLCKEIYSKLDEIAGRLKSNGYVPNKSHLLQFVEEEDMKDHTLIIHN